MYRSGQNYSYGDKVVEESVVITTHDEPSSTWDSSGGMDLSNMGTPPRVRTSFGRKVSTPIGYDVSPIFPTSGASSDISGSYRRSPQDFRNARHSTPVLLHPPSFQRFGSTIEGSDVSSSFSLKRPRKLKVGGVPSKYQYTNVHQESSTVGSSVFNVSSDVSSKIFERESPSVSKEKKKKPESVLQWFDRTCEKELSKRLVGPYDDLEVPQMRGLEKPLMVQASTSGVEFEGILRQHQDTELYEACDKLAKAQAMDMFKGAVLAAEEAAANAPPEYAEEAAAAGARGYQAELTTVVKEEVPGIRPMEVIGYVGVTRPRRPKKS